MDGLDSVKMSETVKAERVAFLPYTVFFIIAYDFEAIWCRRWTLSRVDVEDDVECLQKCVDPGNEWVAWSSEHTRRRIKHADLSTSTGDNCRDSPSHFRAALARLAQQRHY